MISYVLAMGKTTPRTARGCGIQHENFLAGPFHYITRSPGYMWVSLLLIFPPSPSLPISLRPFFHELLLIEKFSSKFELPKKV